VHGGFWRPAYDRSLENAVAADLCERGYLVWNIDYAAADTPWPATLTDVAAAYDHAVTSSRVDGNRIAVVGHSAGGHLALWLASRTPPAGVPRPALAVGQAPVAALAEAAREALGSGAAQALIGGTPEQVPDRYAVADPVALLPTGVPTVLIHGTADDTVPVGQSEHYVAAATAAGDASQLRTYAGGHYEHLDPASEAAQLLRTALASGL
jgi:acetyl esterase/lipase